MYYYDPLTNVWISYAVEADMLENCGMTVCGGKLYVSGNAIFESSNFSNCTSCTKKQIIRKTYLTRIYFTKI